MADTNIVVAGVIASTSSTDGSSRIRRAIPSIPAIRSEFESLLSNSSDDEDSSLQGIDIPIQLQSKGINDNVNKPRLIETGIYEDEDEIILSIIWNKNRLGAAYYNVLTSELFVMEDTTDDVECFDAMKALYRQCMPRYVLTYAGVAGAFIVALKEMITGDTPNQASLSSYDSRRTAELKVMCRKEHNYERCSQRVRCLRLESEPKEASIADRLTFLNTILNFKCCTMIHALGSLLLFIDKHWNDIALVPSGRPSFVSLNFITLQDLVAIDEDTYEALNIVRAKDHPSLFKFGKTDSKTRGASLFTLLSRYCLSQPGVQFLWKALHHPTRNLDVLEERLNAIEFFLDLNNQNFMENLSSCLRHVYRLTNAILACCSGPQAKASNWYKLHKTVSHVICIGDICEDHAEKIPTFKRIAESVTTEMQYVKYFIEYIVDFGESRREGKLVVKPNVDPLLDELNHVRRTLPEVLTRMAEKDMREHLPPSVEGCNMLYLPNIGYVLAINKWNPTPPDDDVLFTDLEFKFTINDVRYYKSSSAKELDETVGDIFLKIAMRQNHIIQKLVRYVKKHTGSILRSIQLCAELDTLIAFHKVARDYNYVRPILIDSKILEVVEGRHPLLECDCTFAPNDIHSGNGKSLIKVITGPNSCGKSVYLKQVGLLLFMAHIGSYVPAKSATIGTIDRISTQLSYTESIGLNASSFLQNLRQINVALRASTSKSLVITDELDRNTSEISGSSLVAAVLNEFAEKGADCPHVFATTHAHGVLALLPRTSLIQVQTFEYTLNEDDSLAFLYRLTNGSSQRSFAHSAARVAELDEKVVKRSLEVYEKIKQDTLPSPVDQRFETVKRIVELFESSTDLDLDEVKSLVRQAVHPK
ncbi:mutS protein homolog 5-like isoform X2 [Osmia bicornis bicornis]|uniref:mutS protein homolog 5-like isoform X2 n=1 Tax=Osmia bicornis bicornis TaxID=1437191 RepID=UPI001EAF8A1F|nr:mutS protein homolog 5-like isoform X2 [Osmia bicornis bicornis]